MNLKQENTELKSVLQQMKKELSFFISVGKALTSTLEVDKVLDIIMENVHKLVSSESWSLLLSDVERNDLYYAITKGRQMEGQSSRRITSGKGIAGWVAENGKPLIVHNVPNSKRFSIYYKEHNKGFIPRDVMCIPIINKKKTIGVLEIINKKNRTPFTKKDKELMLKLIDQAAIAIERSDLYQRMANLAVTDDLTKLFNLRYLYRALNSELKRSRRYNSRFSVIFLDLDSFKLVNDRHGHLAGSKTLVEVAGLLLNALRDVDIISRYGGDEFVIVLPHTPVDVALSIAKRIQEDINNHTFLTDDGLCLRITASFGIAGYPEHAKDEIELLKLSDQAMYMAKSLGKNRVVLTSTVPALTDKS
ncbi:MAG: sensor domain-containing diguanylate cyclase [Nitrospirae bacterium]|nr:sensor domain-containing diguanylate cyclase [Nitrospirota bacterium]